MSHRAGFSDGWVRPASDPDGVVTLEKLPSVEKEAAPRRAGVDATWKRAFRIRP